MIEKYLKKVQEAYEKAWVKMVQDMVVYGPGIVSMDEEGIMSHIPFPYRDYIAKSTTTSKNSQCYNLKCKKPSTPNSFYCSPECHDQYINDIYGPNSDTSIVYGSPEDLEYLKTTKAHGEQTKTEPKCTCSQLSWGAHDNTCPWIIWKQDRDKH